MIVLSLGSLQVTGGRFQGFLEMGASVGTLPHSLKGQSGALVHLGDELGPGAQTLQNMNVETALLGLSSSYSTSAHIHLA